MKIMTVSEMLKKNYGEKVYRLSLSSGCTCPNRDGTKGFGGCIFCSEGGSGEFGCEPIDLDLQIMEAKKLISKKTDAKKFIAYFQSYTNTYGDPDRLKELYMRAISREEIVILDIGTRPDCLGDDMLDMLKELNSIKPVWVELGLQTANDITAGRINRGYPLSVFDCTYKALKEIDIDVIAHVILGLPGETKEDMLNTVRHLANLDPVLDGIKIHMLQILKNTALAKEYEEDPFEIMTLEEYGTLLIECLKILDHNTVIHRMTGDGPKNLLIEPKWCADKKNVLNTLNRMILMA